MILDKTNPWNNKHPKNRSSYLDEMVCSAVMTMTGTSTIKKAAITMMSMRVVLLASRCFLISRPDDSLLKKRCWLDSYRQIRKVSLRSEWGLKHSPNRTPKNGVLLANNYMKVNKNYLWFRESYKEPPQPIFSCLLRQK